MGDRVAIVTGSSRGIGAAIALKLANMGINVVINYFSGEAAAESVCGQCRALGVRAEKFQADVSDFGRAKALVEFAVETFGRLDILVNNAGRTADNLLLRMTEEQFDSIIDANLKSAFNMVKHAAPIMAKARTGRIVNMSSVAGVSGNAGQVNYAASKAGLIGLTLSLAKELGGRNVTVNAVAPGMIETDMTAALPDKVKEYAVNATALRRLGKAEEIANLVAFLASEESSFITGQVIKADGGLAL